MSAESQKLLKRHITELCTRISSRMIGQPGDEASAVYVESYFQKLGLRVISHAMPCTGWDLLSTSLSVDGKSFPAVGNMYSPAGKVSATMVLAEPDIPDARFRQLKGKVVAVYGNFEPFPDRLNTFALKAERAGVASVVVIDGNYAAPATKLIRDPALSRMPVMAVSLQAGYRLAKLEGKQAVAEVRARRYKSSTRDVIGVLDGRQEREICIEAHRDAAPDTPSADDNGSGSAVLLELARLLSRTKLRHTVRFVSATAEEFGNVGTPVYARKFARELKRIELMMNVDCVGGALCPLRVFVHKDDTVMALAEKALRPYASMKLVKTESRGWGHIADYLDTSVNAVNVINDWANAIIHTARDEPSNLSYAKMSDVAHYLRDVVVEYDARPTRA